MHCADILIDVFSAESAVLRAQAAAEADGPRASLHVDAARVFVNDAAMRVEASATAGAGRDGRRRHAPDDAGGAPPAVQGRADQHRRRCGGDWPTRRWRSGGYLF